MEEYYLHGNKARIGGHRLKHAPTLPMAITDFDYSLEQNKKRTPILSDRDVEFAKEFVDENHK